MKRIIALCCFISGMLQIFIGSAFAQKLNVDSMLQKIAIEKNDSSRISLIIGLFAIAQETDPLLDMQHAKQLLQQAYDKEDKLTEAMALSEIGYAYKSLGNLSDGLDYNIKALAVAEETGNEELEAIIRINLAISYKELSDHSKALPLLFAANASLEKLQQFRIQSWALMNLAQVYTYMNNTDSALMYAQRAYELCIRIDYKEYLSFICTQLGKVHTKLGNHSLALSYFNIAINDAVEKKSPKYQNLAYYWLADFYQHIGNADSALIYAKKSVAAVSNAAFYTLNARPAKLLADLYEKSNSDSTVKYLKLYMSASDSLLNIKTIQQAQVLSFENQLREQQLAQEKKVVAEQRQVNLQFVLMALGIIVVILLFLLLSRSMITNEKVINFFGVLVLLLVFEFLNLLLHPFLSSITHHSPPLMLLALVCIAALLVPLHHRAEVWAIRKMVEKNRQIRLSAAKETIAKLEGQNPEKDN